MNTQSDIHLFPDQSAHSGDLRTRVASPGFILWLTGLSGSGKSTLATALAPQLHRRTSRVVELLDGDTVRTHLGKGLTFSREDRDTNIRRIGWVADVVARHGGIALVAAISPYRAVREEIKRTCTNVVEVYVHATVETCAARDTKGLYARALRGELPNFTGVSDPYEPPENPDITVSTAEISIDQGVELVLQGLTRRGLIAA
jgi:adenylylsulfate kinase